MRTVTSQDMKTLPVYFFITQKTTTLFKLCLHFDITHTPVEFHACIILSCETISVKKLVLLTLIKYKVPELTLL